MRDAETKSHTQPSNSTAPARPKEDSARLGREIYERDILSQVEADHHGQVVAIDVVRGHWAIGDDRIVAVDRLLAQHPDSHDIWCERVGYRAMATFGGGSLRRAG